MKISFLENSFFSKTFKSRFAHFTHKIKYDIMKIVPASNLRAKVRAALVLQGNKIIPS